MGRFIRSISIVLPIVTALAAAWYWYQSAIVPMPAIDFHLDAMTPEAATALNTAFRAVARLNRIAAEWSAASALSLAVSQGLTRAQRKPREA